MKSETTRDTVAKLMAEAGGDDEPAADTGGSEAPAGEPAAAAEVHDTGGPGASAAPAAEGGERARGADGKFVAKPAEKVGGKPEAKVAGELGTHPAAAPTQQATTAAPVSAQAPHDLKPPADWRPLAKEKWAQLPREVQEETLRLHSEAKKGMEDSAPAKQHLEEFRRAVSPFEGMIRAAGSEPMKAIGGLLQREAALLQSPPQTRAQILAQGIRQYLGTDKQAIDLLAQAIDSLGAGTPAGVPPQHEQQPANVESLVQKALDQRLQAAVLQKATTELQAFQADPKNEFFARVGLPMLKLIGAGLAQDYQDAYAQACARDPEIAAVLKQRGDAEAARRQQQTAPAQAAAAAGVKSEPGGPVPSGKAKSTREEVEKQMARLTSRARV